MSRCARRLTAASVSLLLMGGCAGTPAGLQPHALKDEAGHKGYLSQDALAALAAHIPAPPASGSTADQADKAASQALRRFENTDRWLLATSHAEVRSPFALQHFDCVLGVRYDPDQHQAPATARVFDKLFEDAEAASTLVKRRAFRARPVGDETDREACQTVSTAGRNSPSYPSGSATVGAAYGAAMAAIAPDKAAEVYEIGRQIALSRAICGMHYPTDVRVGAALGQAVFAQAARSPEFRADLTAAQAELARLRARGRTNPGCAAERRALAMSRDLGL